MKIMIVGDWHSDLHEEEVYRAILRLGHKPLRFRWVEYITPVSARPGSMLWLWKRLQDKFVFGPVIRQINRELVKEVISKRPDVILIYRGTHIWANTVREIKRMLKGCFVIGYSNDDPFSMSQPKYLWRHFKESLKEYDLSVAYRHCNIRDFIEAGARHVHLMRSWYVKNRNYPLTLGSSDIERFGCDVVFAGHYEDDGRLAMLEEVIDQGYKLRVFGPERAWRLSIRKSSCLSTLKPIGVAWGEDYNKALNGAKIALCFLSKLNRDTYTRRCFEIPATKTLLLAEYSDDLASLFEEGIEADFFRNRDEFIYKMKMYMHDEELRREVAEAGYNRVQRSGHEIECRIAELIQRSQEVQAGV